jgi:hypothetical protein
MLLLGEVDRTIEDPAIGVYSCDTEGNWTEEAFTDTTMTMGMLEDRVVALESKVARLERVSKV